MRTFSSCRRRHIFLYSLSPGEGGVGVICVFAALSAKEDSRGQLVLMTGVDRLTAALSFRKIGGGRFTLP